MFGKPGWGDEMIVWTVMDLPKVLQATHNTIASLMHYAASGRFQNQWYFT